MEGRKGEREGGREGEREGGLTKNFKKEGKGKVQQKSQLSIIYSFSSYLKPPRCSIKASGKEVQQVSMTQNKLLWTADSVYQLQITLRYVVVGSEGIVAKEMLHVSLIRYDKVERLLRSVR